MAATSLALKVALGLLMVDSIIELSFISSMVAWLHSRSSGSRAFFIVDIHNDTTSNSGQESLSATPANMMVNQGHTSNGAAGTAFILIGCGGILALWLRNRSNYHTKSFNGSFSRFWYNAWLVLNVPALLLTLGSLAYVFAVTNAHSGQTIDLEHVVPAGMAYPLGVWTPQNWFQAVLKLDLPSVGDRADIESHYKVMLGWQYNLIPMFLIQLVETALAFHEGMRRRKESNYGYVEKDVEAVVGNERKTGQGRY